MLEIYRKEKNFTYFPLITDLVLLFNYRKQDLLIGKINDEIVCYAVVANKNGIYAKKHYLFLLVVADPYKSKGLGTEMLERLQREHPYLILDCRKNMVSYYRKKGFEESKRGLVWVIMKYQGENKGTSVAKQKGKISENIFEKWRKKYV